MTTASVIPLPTTAELARALEIKRQARPLSVSRRGFLKASGKWSADRIAAVRAANLALAQRRAAGG